MDRIFLDANILFSIAYGSPCLNDLFKIAEGKHCLLFTSKYVIEEARRNLTLPQQIEKLEAFLPKVQIVPEVDTQMACPIQLPEKDRPVLLAAISIKANFLLTGDTIHFGKYFGKTISGVRICRPRDYFSLIKPQGK